MKFLALEHEQPGVQPGDFQPYLKVEATSAWRLYLLGVVREAYFRADQHTAVFILECASKEDADRELAQLPLVQAGLITFEVIPLQPYDGYARLFSS